MASAGHIQALLRFLSQEAKVPLATAMAKVKDLQQAGLTSPEEFKSCNPDTLSSIFSDPKVNKQIIAAAKRVTRRRSLTEGEQPSPSKRKKVTNLEKTADDDPDDSIALPALNLDEDEISKAAVFTNRAPLVLAFAVMLLKYTAPDQPLSSRLSLAQAVVSVNSRSKAVSLGLESGQSAEDAGWGQGQPVIKVMGREIRVMKRWRNVSKAECKPGHDSGDDQTKGHPDSIAADTKAPLENQDAPSPSLWGLDLEALRASNGPKTPDASRQTGSLPIFTPKSAQAYLLKAFASSAPEEASMKASAAEKKRSRLLAEEEKLRNLGLLLGALDLLYKSWHQVLSKEELDRRAWSWYVHVRPDVETGVAGWGGKGRVRLSEILDLRRSA